MLGVPRQTVYRWREELKVGGIEALRAINKGARPAQLDAAELSQLYVALLEGPSAHGFSTPLWTLKRVPVWRLARPHGTTAQLGGQDTTGTNQLARQCERKRPEFHCIDHQRNDDAMRPS